MGNLPVRSVEKVGETVVRAVVEAGGKGWSWDLLLRSDAHHDNAHCRVDLEKLHLDQALERGAGILDIGDMFCAMQGPRDPRQDKTQLRDRDKRNDYFDGLVEEHTEFYRRYAANWLMLSPGNHERSVVDHHGTDLTKRLGENLRSISGQPIGIGTYQGWLQIQFKFLKTRGRNYRFRYTHGYGGGGPVTKDLIQANRQLAFLEGADFLLSGHTHDAWYVPQVREMMDDYGNACQREVGIIKIGGYKDEYSPGEGFAVLKGRGPRPRGGWWVRFYYDRQDIRYQITRVEDL